MSRVTRQLKYKTLKSKQNAKRSFILSGGVSLGVIVFGLSVSIPVYVSMQAKLKSTVSDVFNIQKILNDLARMLGLKVEDLMGSDLGNTGWKIRGQGSSSFILENEKINKTIVISLNKDGSLASAGSLSGAAAKEIISIINSIKNDLNNDKDVINDIFDTVGKNAEYTSMRIEAKVLRSRIRAFVTKEGLHKSYYEDDGLGIAIIMVRNAFKAGSNTEIEKKLKEIVADNNDDIKKQIDESNISEFSAIAKELIRLSILDESDPNAKKEIDDAIEAEKDKIEAEQEEAKRREEELVNGVNDIKNEAEGNAAANNPTLIKKSVQSLSNWTALYAQTFGFEGKVASEHKEPSTVLRAAIKKGVLEYYGAKFTEEHFDAYTKNIEDLLGIQTINGKEIATKKIRLTTGINQDNLFVFKVTTNIHQNDFNLRKVHHIGSIITIDDKDSTKNEIKLEFINSDIKTVDPNNNRSMRLVSFNELIEIYNYTFPKMRISTTYQNKYIKGDNDQIEAKVVNKIHNIINNPTMTYANTFNRGLNNGVSLTPTSQFAEILKMIEAFNRLDNYNHEVFYHELFLKNIDDYLFNGKWVNFTGNNGYDHKNVITEYISAWPSAYISKFPEYARSVRAKLNQPVSIPLDYGRIKSEFPFV